jgi:phenylpropionate dioxygenase-like ring-hydroxylating dioxygenase large terminal subunit
METATQITGIRPGTTRFPRYDAAVLGFDGYWWPVMFGEDLGRKPTALTLFGQEIVFFRERGTVHALQDRCPHRGIPLSIGRQEFPGTWTCRYHGWTFDLQTGTLVAALTDGPDSPMCGKARVQTYPVEERAGLVWIFKGEGEPPPVEAHIPEEFLRADAVVEGRITERSGDWRYAAENGFDDGHPKYLHRNSLYLFLRRTPGYGLANIVPEVGGWIKRAPKSFAMQADYPGLGVWPKSDFWRFRGGGPRISIRLPATLRVHQGEWAHFEWYVPTAPGRHRYLQFVLKHATGLSALEFRLRYRLWLRWVFHGLFNDQDACVVETMNTPPEQLYRPDNSLIGWRKLCEEFGGIDTTVLRSVETATDVVP